MSNDTRTLYQRLGDEQAIEQILTSLDNKVINDATLGEFFKGVDLKKTHEKTKSYLIKFLGGPSEDKEEKDMGEAHKNLKITDAHYTYFVHLWRENMIELGFGEELANQTTWLIETLREKITNQKSLYQRIGGDEVMNKIGQKLSEVFIKDDVLGPIYSKTEDGKGAKLGLRYTKVLFGEPVHYQGQCLTAAHKKFELEERHFDRFIFLFEEAFRAEGIKPELTSEAMRKFEATRFKIVKRPSVYTQLGGIEGVGKVISNFHKRALLDDNIKPFFDGFDAQRLAVIDEKYKHYFSHLWGGPDTYSGMSVRGAHKNMKLTDQLFNLTQKHMYITIMGMGFKEDVAREAIDRIERTRFEVLGRPTIIERVGGRDALDKITEEFHQALLKDQILGPFYSKAKSNRLAKDYAQHFAHLFGNTDNFPGSLSLIHGCHHLTDEHYDVFLATFKQVLTNRKIDEKTIQEAVDVLETKRNDVVERKSLWMRLGGFEQIEKVCDLFEQILLADPVMGPIHKDLDMKKYHENHRDMLAELFQGYHFYSGRTLQEAHRPFKLKDEHFNLFVSLFVRAFEEAGTSQELIKEVRGVFELERNEVLNRRSLYEKLGGEKSIELLVEKLNQKLAEDPVLGPMHKNVDWTKLLLHRKQFFIQLFGNLNVYEGKDLRTAHNDLHLNEDHFIMFEKHFKDAMAEMGFTEEPVKQALTLLETTRREVLNSTSVYDKLGGREGVENFVRTLDQLSAKNTELAPFFKNVDMSKLNEHRYQYFANMFGGKESYEGKSMHSAHDALPLSDKHLKVFLTLVQDALNEVGAEQSVREDVVMMLQSKRNEVINQ